MADVLDPQPPIRLFASDESPRMAELAQHFLGEPIAEARMVSPDRLMAPSRPRSSRAALAGPPVEQKARLSA
jgi:hypothetical protein